MCYYNFEQIKEKIMIWGSKLIQEKVQYIKLTRNEKDVLIFDLTFSNCLGQIVVCNQFFAPYYCVSFEAMTFDTKKAVKNDSPDLVYFFYDTDKMKENEVIRELEIGVEYCLGYIPNQLEETYINKKGIVNINTEKLSKMIHPDDICKIHENTLVGEFICSGVQSQYLIIENMFIVIRVLPDAFEIIQV